MSEPINQTIYTQMTDEEGNILQSSTNWFNTLEEFFEECDKHNVGYYHPDVEFTLYNGTTELEWEDFTFDSKGKIIGLINSKV